MKNNKCIKLIILLVVFLFACNISNYATGYNNFYSPPNNYQYYNPNYNPNFNPNYNPNYNPNFNPNYNPYYYPYNQGNLNVIPSNSYYFISGYDRAATNYYNGQAMVSRVPIISGNNYFPTRIANGIIYNAYVSISDWCNANILTKEGIQDYFLNNATIINQTASSIVLHVNCAHKRSGILSGYTEFRVNVDISRNKFTWKKLGKNVVDNSDDLDDIDDYKVYEYDSDSGQIIIIR